MADDSLRSAMPVAKSGGFAGRQPNQPPGQAAKPPVVQDPPKRDSVRLLGAATVAPELVRERVLAYTRTGLGLDEAETPEFATLPEFAEVRLGEPAAIFLGRLLSAQNQLAARRAGSWTGERVRRCLDQALRAGCEEAIEMLTAELPADASAVRFVVEVMTDYERRLACLLDEIDPAS